MENLNFGQTLDALNEGKKVCRAGWNGKGMWLKLVVPYTPQFPIRDAEVENLVEGSTMLSWIGMRTADNKFVPWLASQTDVLANDWQILN